MTAAPTTSAPAGCPDCVQAGQARERSRRELLRGGLWAALGVAGAAGAGAADVRFAMGAQAAGLESDTLVVLSLRGGFDGLNAVPAIGDPQYASLRPTVAIPASAALPLNSTFGLHPALAPLKPLYDGGKLAFVQATGLGEANRSHFAATAELERAAPGTSIRTGWLDRVLSWGDQSAAFAGVGLRADGVNAAFLGSFPEVSISSLSSVELNASWEGTRAAWNRFLTNTHAQADPLMVSSANRALAAVTQVRTLSAVAPAATYPDSELGKALADVARLIKANAGVRVATIDVGDWDMHAGMGTVGSGWLHERLTDLGASLKAFHDDLGEAFGRVTLVTLSEFGRRVAENESGGVDHGWGNTVMVLGGGVNGGQIYGTWLGLSGAGLVDGDLRVTTDYRDILADILAHRLNATSAQVGSALPGWSGASLGITAPR